MSVYFRGPIFAGITIILAFALIIAFFIPYMQDIPNLPGSPSTLLGQISTDFSLVIPWIFVIGLIGIVMVIIGRER